MDAFPKSSNIHTLQEKPMATKLFDAWAVLFNGARYKSARYEAELLTYAKTEYGKDWQYAYQYMLTHNGRGPGRQWN